MTARPHSRKNPVTGETLVRGVRRITLRYKVYSVDVDMPGWYAEDDQDGETGIYDAQDMLVSDRALRIMKAREQGLLEPTEIRKIRKRLKLTQKQAGELIGGGPNAFQKYEAGDVMLSKAADTALRLLGNDPARLQELST